ncbi:MAG: GTP pyrophosphokinase [Lachnospiraceae bacterium]|nr:GTP pyrophosphokinase [Lachnospiraceae bacterium]
MLYTELTKRAMVICFDAHKNQRDKGGVPYVFHPFHVAEQMETEEEICTALLHDVVEDTALTLDRLAAEGFPPSVIEALSLLTHKDGTPYLEYVERLKDNPIAAVVKLADLEHNSMPGRLSEIKERDRERLEKYRRAREILTKRS